MNPLFKRLYDLTPVRVQEALLSAFSARLEKQRYGGRFAEFRKLLEEAESWSLERIGEWQDAQLRRIVRHAYETVPYYHVLFDRHGIDSARFSGREDLPRIPLLTREVVKTRAAELRSSNPTGGAFVEGHTSGTTGSPLSVYFCSDMVAMNYAAMDRQYRWADARLGRDGDRVAVLRGNVIVPLAQQGPPFWRYNRNLNQLILSSFHLSTRNLPAYFDALRAFQPRVLDGYPSSIYVLAKVLLNAGQTLPLHAVVTSSETLYDFQREAIESAFECRVFDYYAAAERVVFSTECSRHQGHHVCEEYGATEFVDEDGAVVAAGVEGFLVGTSLHNTAMPLLRYRTTDRCAIRPSACSCGRAHRLLEDVTTKAEDLLRLKDGRMIPPSVLTHPFKPLDSIEASQIVQTDLDRLVVRMIPTPAYSASDADHLIRELKARLGQDMRIDIELVDTLPRTSRGKFKWVISNVDLGI